MGLEPILSALEADVLYIDTNLFKIHITGNMGLEPIPSALKAVVLNLILISLNYKLLATSPINRDKQKQSYNIDKMSVPNRSFKTYMVFTCKMII